MPSSKSCLKSENGCFNKERMGLVKQLVADGNTNAEIADVLDTSVRTVADMLYRWGIKRDKQRPCKMCGKPVNSSHPKTVYCEQCRKKAASEYAKRSARKYPTKKTCEYCGKEFLGRATAKYCSTPCYRKAVASGKHKKPQSWLKRRSGKIDIEIRICGKVSERRENVDYYDAREIWHKGWLGQGYAAMITVDGILLETIPQITKFFGFGREEV
jgi:transposase